MKNRFFSKKRFSKFAQRFKPLVQPQVPSDSDSDSDVPADWKVLDADVWSVILLNVDPSCIFKCIVVSKQWLEIITSSNFQTNYMKKWKIGFEVVGFLQKDGWFPLVVTNKLGSLINKTRLNVQGDRRRFVSKSSSGDILCTVGQTFYVFNLATNFVATPLPPPPMYFKFRSMAITSSYHQDASFKVIMADTVHPPSYSKTLSIQTFSSSTSTWERSELTCCCRFRLTGATGIGSSRGMVYWPAISYDEPHIICLAAYATNNQQLVRLIPGPDTKDKLTSYYDVSPQGRIWCATTFIEEKTNLITIWSLGEDDIEFKVSYIIDTASVCRLAGRRHLSRLYVVSLNPGKADSIFVAWEWNCDLFVYDIDNQELERFEGSFPKANILETKHFVPLTTVELGFWPSSPHSWIK